jgi:thymidylate synthase
MNYIDAQYLDLLKDIIENGVRKNTRAGEVLSVFGRSMRFNLRDGLPLLTTKKVFTKGIIHELIWFLKGDTNIKYLIDNNVNIWTDDAYRYYTELVTKHNKVVAHELSRDFYKIQPIDVVSKEEFIKRVGLQQKELFILNENNYIMSAMMGAGIKNSDNTFSGVMLGDWSDTDTASEVASQTGVYGFHHGM